MPASSSIRCPRAVRAYRRRRTAPMLWCHCGRRHPDAHGLRRLAPTLRFDWMEQPPAYRRSAKQAEVGTAQREIGACLLRRTGGKYVLPAIILRIAPRQNRDGVEQISAYRMLAL